MSVLGWNIKTYVDFSQCYSQTDKAADCAPQGDDYVECLFHHREVCLPTPSIFPVSAYSTIAHTIFLDRSRKTNKSRVHPESRTPSERGPEDSGCAGGRGDCWGRPDSARQGGRGSEIERYEMPFLN